MKQWLDGARIVAVLLTLEFRNGVLNDVDALLFSEASG